MFEQLELRWIELMNNEGKKLAGEHGGRAVAQYVSQCLWTLAQMFLELMQREATLCA